LLGETTSGIRKREWEVPKGVEDMVLLAGGTRDKNKGK